MRGRRGRGGVRRGESRATTRLESRVRFGTGSGVGGDARAGAGGELWFWREDSGSGSGSGSGTGGARARRLRLGEEIGRGGMGVVIRARDPELERDVAVKVLLEEHRGRSDLVRRFLEEARIAAQLQHPGVVPVYEIGAFPDRRPYFAMRLVRGRTLEELLDALGPRPGAEARWRLLSIFESICQTMAYVHARGVIHRDLKPANVMVGRYGEVQIMDWGLAKVLERGPDADRWRERGSSGSMGAIRLPLTGRDWDWDVGEGGSTWSGLGQGDGEGEDSGSVSGPGWDSGSDSEVARLGWGMAGDSWWEGRVRSGRSAEWRLSETGRALGTLSYMAPEQARGELEAVDERADVFALGSMLCELLTGRPVIWGEDRETLLRETRSGNVGPGLERLASRVEDAEIQELVRACVAPRPEDRPRDAGVLAERVSELLSGARARWRAAEFALTMEARLAACERRERGLATCLAAALAALALLGVWRLAGSGSAFPFGGP